MSQHHSFVEDKKKQRNLSVWPHRQIYDEVRASWA